MSKSDEFRQITFELEHGFGLPFKTVDEKPLTMEQVQGRFYRLFNFTTGILVAMVLMGTRDLEEVKSLIKELKKE